MLKLFKMLMQIELSSPLLSLQNPKRAPKSITLIKKSAKSKKIVFKATNKKIKYGKKYKSSMIVKNGKSRYVYIGKKRYLKSTAVKVTNVKYSPLNLPDDIKNLIVNN